MLTSGDQHPEPWSPAELPAGCQGEFRLGALEDVPRARHWIRATLDKLTASSASATAHLVDAVELCAAELLANAAQCSDMSPTRAVCARLAMLRDAGNGQRAVRVEVNDPGNARGERPAARLAEPDAESGRGLAIVATLASRWGTTTANRGNLVWFEVEY
ncbi:ATP-binding protein [Actinomadura sp. SCN-SB]|uniref:ATP-binding protein n=1 Tax=Actinomadura sp. SCN-SB TaxID=3373092 RepID=UPI003751A9AD